MACTSANAGGCRAAASTRSAGACLSSASGGNRLAYAASLLASVTSSSSTRSVHSSGAAPSLERRSSAGLNSCSLAPAQRARAAAAAFSPSGRLISTKLSALFSLPSSSKAPITGLTASPVSASSSASISTVARRPAHAEIGCFSSSSNARSARDPASSTCSRLSASSASANGACASASWNARLRTIALTSCRRTSAALQKCAAVTTWSRTSAAASVDLPSPPSPTMSAQWPGCPACSRSAPNSNDSPSARASSAFMSSV